MKTAPLPMICPQCSAMLNGTHNCWNCTWVWEGSDFSDRDLWSDKEKFDRLHKQRYGVSRMKLLIKMVDKIWACTCDFMQGFCEALSGRGWWTTAFAVLVSFIIFTLLVTVVLALVAGAFLLVPTLLFWLYGATAIPLFGAPVIGYWPFVGLVWFASVLGRLIFHR